MPCVARDDRQSCQETVRGAECCATLAAVLFHSWVGGWRLWTRTGSLRAAFAELKTGAACSSTCKPAFAPPAAGTPQPTTSADGNCCRLTTSPLHTTEHTRLACVWSSGAVECGRGCGAPTSRHHHVHRRARHGAPRARLNSPPCRHRALRTSSRSHLGRHGERVPARPPRPMTWTGPSNRRRRHQGATPMPPSPPAKGLRPGARVHRHPLDEPRRRTPPP